MVGDCDCLKKPGTTKAALLRGLTTPFSRGCVLAHDETTPQGPLKLPTQLTNLIADWSTETGALPTGRSSCESKGIFGKGKPNGREFLASRGIPTPMAAGVHDWFEALATPSGQSAGERIAIFGTDNSCELPEMRGIPTPAAVSVYDWSEPNAPPTGRCTQDAIGILGNDKGTSCELPAMLRF